MFDFAMAVSLQREYDEYLMECVDTNTLPLDFSEWWESLED